MRADIAKALLPAVSPLHLEALHTVRQLGQMWRNPTADRGIAAQRLAAGRDLRRWCCIDVRRDADDVWRSGSLRLTGVGLELMQLAGGSDERDCG